MTNAHTKTLLANFFTLWQDPESPFGKWDFYGELFNMIEDKKITYKEAHEVTKSADSEWGQGIKVDILKMRVRDCRHGMTKTELLRRRKDRKSNQNKTMKKTYRINKPVPVCSLSEWDVRVYASELQWKNKVRPDNIMDIHFSFACDIIEAEHQTPVEEEA